MVEINNEVTLSLSISLMCGVAYMALSPLRDGAYTRIRALLIVGAVGLLTALADPANVGAVTVVNVVFYASMLLVDYANALLFKRVLEGRNGQIQTDIGRRQGEGSVADASDESQPDD